MPSRVNCLVFGTLIAAFIFVGVRAGYLGKLRPSELKKRMGPADWKFPESWASTITLVGGILGTILAQSDVVPVPTHYLSNAAYGTLNVLFVMITLLAPLLYTAMQKVEGTSESGKEPEFQGLVGWFLVASALTSWGVLGQLFTVAHLVAEIELVGGLPPGPTYLFHALVLLAVVLLGVYVWRGIDWRLKYQTIPSVPRAAEAERDRIEPRLRSWPVF